MVDSVYYLKYVYTGERTKKEGKSGERRRGAPHVHHLKASGFAAGNHRRCGRGLLYQPYDSLLYFGASTCDQHLDIRMRAHFGK